MIHVRVDRLLCNADAPTEGSAWVYEAEAHKSDCPLCRLKAGVAGGALRLVDDVDVDPPFLLYVPIRTVNTSNQRESWQARATRAAAERRDVALTWLAAVQPHMRKPERLLPCEVKMTRVAPRELDGHDGLPASMKAVADEIAVCLGLKNDRDPRVEWKYAQRKGGPQEYAVEIELRRK